MKKGADPAILFMIMDELVEGGLSTTDRTFKFQVQSQYNAIHKVPSLRTKISNKREEAIIAHQDKLLIFKLPQDGNGMDLAAYKLDDTTIKFILVQQKGNNSTLNGGGKEKAIEKVKEFIDQDKITEYFYLLPDDLNPDKTGYEYSVEPIFGYYLATGSADFSGIPVYTNNAYLKKIGIDNSIVRLDRWVISNLDSLEYNAVEKCTNFDEIYEECLTYYN